MEAALGIFKFWRNSDATSSFTDDDCSDDDDDSLFDLVLKGDNNEIESPRDVFLSSSSATTTRNDHRFSNSKPSSPLRSAPKFKVFMLGFTKSSKAETKGDTKAASPLSKFCKSSSKLGQSKRFSLKCSSSSRVEEERPANTTTPIFARDNSLRSKMLRENTEYDVVVQEKSSVPKYMKLIKPLVSKKASKSSNSVTPLSSPVTVPVNLSPRKFSESSRVGSFKIVTRKNLMKSRSALAAAGGVEQPLVHRRDDSLLEQQHDGIQGAILHCKKSFASLECSQLSRSSSDPPHGKLGCPVRNSCEEMQQQHLNTTIQQEEEEEAEASRR